MYLYISIKLFINLADINGYDLFFASWFTVYMDFNKSKNITLSQSATGLYFI